MRGDPETPPERATMKFSQQAWSRIDPIYGAILEHPFIRELSQGSLSRARFQFYMTQDALYLAEFAAVLSLIAGRAPDPDTQARFEASARNVMMVEQALHETFFREFGVEDDMTARAGMTPACFSYTNYLHRVVGREPVAVAVAAVLPCFWIYWQVGRHIRSQAAPENPYQRWIETYGNPDFGARVDNFTAIADGMAASAPPETQAAMLEAFRRAAQLEWMFWDSAYRLESWPV
jgi:thiaminase/transcriptional activator TenA